MWSSSFRFKLSLVFLAGFAVVAVRADDGKPLAYHFDRIESINGTGEYFKYDLDIKKQDDSVFLVQANIEQLVELSDEWKVTQCRIKLSSTCRA